MHATKVTYSEIKFIEQLKHIETLNYKINNP